MNTRKYIGRGIRCIQLLYQIDKDIVAGKCCWAQMQSVRKDRTDDKEKGHSSDAKCGHFVKLFLVGEENKEAADKYIHEP